LTSASPEKNTVHPEVIFSKKEQLTLSISGAQPQIPSKSSDSRLHRLLKPEKRSPSDTNHCRKNAYQGQNSANKNKNSKGCRV
jgi:hypothetical protein